MFDQEAKMTDQSRRVFVTGGGGYVGAVLVPQLLKAGYAVTVLDLFLFGEEVLASVANDPKLRMIKGDLRDLKVVRDALNGCSDVIHLACISNDPSFELNPALGKTINFDCFEPLVDASRAACVRRFIYASSSSVYGISDEPNVTEDHPLRPLTDYSKFKAMCEPILLSRQSPDFTTMVIRPATLCGYSPRQRLDLTVNILTNLAVNRGKITVFGGSQLRPNFHIQDMVDLYLQLLSEPATRIAGKTYNAGYENHSVADIAVMVRNVVQRMMPERRIVEIVTSPSDDLRSYHISSERIAKELDYRPKRTIEDAISDLVRAFQAGLLPDSLTGPQYFNIKTMQASQLS